MVEIEQSKRWQTYPTAPESMFAESPEHPLLTQVLYNRGLRSVREITAFLAGSDAVQENPYRFCDMVPAVQRILQAVEQGETVCVYGDFDADGVTSTALLVSALQAAGARVGPYIPDRVDEGYGLNAGAIERIAGQARLMITVDCGIRSVVEVAQARALGLDVIVTDHHSIGPELPEALAIINPRRKECPSTFKSLAGVGVAYRLAQAVLRSVAQQSWSSLTADQAAELEDLLLDYVAIGTVADMMPLQGANRSLVRRGLEQLNRTERPGLEALISQAGLQPGTVDASAISFRIAPRINAAGRLSHAKLAYRLLRTTDPGQAFTWTSELEELNLQRRALTLAAQQEAERQLTADLTDGAHLIVAASPDFRPGVVGLVAGKLADRFYRPVLVIEEGEIESRGSARSIEEFDISRALDEVAHLLVRHGGHSRAAGFTVRTEAIGELTEALQGIARRELSTYPDLRPLLHIDAAVNLADVNWAVQVQMARLEPSGQGNPAPIFVANGVRVREARAVGAKQHLKLVVDSGPGSPVFDAIAFGFGTWAGRLDDGSLIDIVFGVGINEWQGRRSLQLMVEDLRSASS